MLGGGLPVLVQQLLMRKIYARLEEGQSGKNEKTV